MFRDDCVTAFRIAVAFAPSLLAAQMFSIAWPKPPLITPLVQRWCRSKRMLW
jgi:hypothetical protein